MKRHNIEDYELCQVALNQFLYLPLARRVRFYESCSNDSSMEQIYSENSGKVRNKSFMVSAIFNVSLAPYTRESGSYKGTRHIFTGRSRIRKVLDMATVACLRCNEKLKVFYDRLAGGKIMA